MSFCFRYVIVSAKLVSMFFTCVTFDSCLGCVAASCICFLIAMQLCTNGVPSRVASCAGVDVISMASFIIEWRCMCVLFSLIGLSSVVLIVCCVMLLCESSVNRSS